MCTHTEKLILKKNKKLMKITSILNTYQCKKTCWSPSVGKQK